MTGDEYGASGIEWRPIRPLFGEESTVDPRPSFECPRCGARSYHLTDLDEGYCGHCHDWTAESKTDVVTEDRSPMINRAKNVALPAPDWGGLGGTDGL